MGIVSCLGKDLDTVAQSLEQGRSGVILDREREKLGFKSPLSVMLPDISPKAEGLSRKHLRTMCEPALYATVAARQALGHAGLKARDIQTPRCGVVFGNDSTVKAGVASIDIAREHQETHYIGAGYIFKAMNSTITMNLAGLFGTQGANWTVSAACASGAHVLGQAAMLIRSGAQDLIIAGGAQETHWTAMASFDALGAFSSRTSHPQKASRPFDAERDGLIPSGGGAAMVIESLDRALARKAKIYGIIEGYGFSSGMGRTLSDPGSRGAYSAMAQALQDAGKNPEEIDYINAHATSTPVGDLAEARAIHDLFGAQVPVSSTKSMTGHECWMSGASEVIYTTLMAAGDFIAPNINFKALSPDCPPVNVVAVSRKQQIKTSLSNSFGFGGTNASLVLNFEETY